jgi:hypothetical protein
VTAALWLLIDVPLSALAVASDGGANPGAFIGQHLEWYVARVASCIGGVPLFVAVLLSIYDFLIDPLTRQFGRFR